MSETTVDVLGPIASPQDRWSVNAVSSGSALAELVYRSNLLGADRTIANEGGGNTSAKGTSTDHAGRAMPQSGGVSEAHDGARLEPVGGAHPTGLQESGVQDPQPDQDRQHERSAGHA